MIDDYLSHTSLAERGWKVETISWRNPAIDWSQFACAIIRSTWDYQKDLPAFLDTLEEIASATWLLNPLPIVRWNADKTYLRDLQSRGARIVPTIWSEEPIEPNDLIRWTDELQSDELVIKPTVSANADRTVRLSGDQFSPELASTFVGRSYMVQPFMRGIEDEGEFSLFYFNGEYSHAIVKKPKPQDFRVQEEHGGLIRPTSPSPDLLRAGEEALRLVGATLLYARVDFVCDGDAFALMELELIEPSLYLRTDEAAPQRFADAVVRCLATSC